MHKNQSDSIEDTRERIENAMQYSRKDRYEFETRRKTYLETTQGGS